MRRAGGLYLIIILSGLSAELALRGPALTDGLSAADIPALRLSLLADLVMLVADVGLAVVFYRLLRCVNQSKALAAMVLRLMQAGLIGGGLVLLSGVPLTMGSDLAPVLVELHANGYDLGLILFGVNCLIMAQLLCPTRAPFVLSPMLAGSGLVYIGGSLTRLMAPGWSATIEPAYLLCILTEATLCIWLLRSKGL
ncbi:DUF4386 domain-containing protein [Sagittula sp. M10.9X]|uniref:DUF4386 domain-containing protein n=2 Tax=Sagittula salina TaxID=2820268 RepID=A0A940MM47_9RHOB|nr:DUF4386 domain-containing protein [Sagittula salina]